MLFTNYIAYLLLLFSLSDQPRIISLAPSITEIVKAYDVKPIAVSDFCVIDNDIPRLGGLTNPNLEAIVKLNPDTVLLLGTHAGLSQKLKNFNIETRSFYNDSVSDIENSIIEIGKVLHQEQKSSEILKKLNFDKYRLARHQKVALLIAGNYLNQTGLVAAGTKSIYGEILNKMNATNVYAGAYPSTSFESLLLAKPDVLIVFKNPGQEVDISLLKKSYASIKVSVLEDSSLLVPGINVAEISRQFYEVLK